MLRGILSRFLKRDVKVSFDEIDRKVVAQIRSRGDNGKRVRDVIQYTHFEIENTAHEFA